MAGMPQQMMMGVQVNVHQQQQMQMPAQGGWVGTERDTVTRCF
jgi:hypothetical protein